MNLEQCKSLSRADKTQAGLNALWITGREWLRLHDRPSMGAWDSVLGAGAGTAPSVVPDAVSLRRSFPAAMAFTESVGLAIDAVPGWFPDADPQTCIVDWQLFACTVQAYAGLDQATRSKAIAQRIAATPEVCSQSEVASDPAYAGFRGAAPGTPAAPRSRPWLWVALPVAAAVAVAAVALSGPASRRT
jgi:hypothetical protein